MSSTRETYDQQIQELRGEVVTMASMVDKAIARSVDALRTQDVQLAQAVRTHDKEINQHRWSGEEHALTIIATQAPMAGDLRTIAAAMQIFTDLERMADHAAGIAKITMDLSKEGLLKPLVDIPRMGDVARKMLGEAVAAFVESDEEEARRIATMDDEIDELHDQVFRELLTFMMEDPATIPRATRLLWASHNLERIGDRVTNICERIVFTVTGEIDELDGGRKSRQRARASAESANGTSG